MNKKIVRIILTIIFFIGVCILTYPFISQYWNSKVQTKAITKSRSDKTFSNKKFLINKKKEQQKLFFKNLIHCICILYTEKTYRLGYMVTEYRRM